MKTSYGASCMTAGRLSSCEIPARGESSGWRSSGRSPLAPSAGRDGPHVIRAMTSARISTRWRSRTDVSEVGQLDRHFERFRCPPGTDSLPLVALERLTTGLCEQRVEVLPDGADIFVERRSDRCVRVECAPQSLTIRGVNEESIVLVAEGRKRPRRLCRRPLATVCETPSQPLLDQASERPALGGRSHRSLGNENVGQFDCHPHVR